jgi:L-amino acid N-acyltransferase YncA
MNTQPQIRQASENDSEAIVDIYNWYIENTYYTFEEESLTAEYMREQMAGADALAPWFVLEEDGEISGFCYAGIWKSRAAYKYSRETTVYLRHDRIGGGRGYRLMEHLVNELRATPIHLLIAGIALPNDASIAVHEKLGFSNLGTFNEVGSKFGKFIDVAYLQLVLTD